MAVITLSREGKERVKLADARKCLSCEKALGGEVPTRGLCTGCYQAARRAIRADKVSENELIKSGLLLNLAPKGRPLSNALAKKLADQ